jgi:hypothetical protein
MKQWGDHAVKKSNGNGNSLPACPRRTSSTERDLLHPFCRLLPALEKKKEEDERLVESGVVLTFDDQLFASGENENIEGVRSN